jgi:hypothetical protein
LESGQKSGGYALCFKKRKIEKKMFFDQLAFIKGYKTSCFEEKNLNHYIVHDPEKHDLSDKGELTQTPLFAMFAPFFGLLVSLRKHLNL